MNHYLENHLKQLDDFSPFPEAPLRTERDKERYESLIMYAFRKLEAAKYHYGNVRTFIARDQLALDDYKDDILNLPDAREIRSTLTLTSDEYVYELSAFLEAIKSAVDLLAEVASVYIRGINANYSIKPLINKIRRNYVGPILNEVAESVEWLLNLRDYRHHLVHRLMPSLRRGHVVSKMQGITSKALYPVVVPEKTPSFVADTRRNRYIESQADTEVPVRGLSYLKSIGRARVTGGKEALVKYEVRVEPSPGYQTIDDFMQKHLSECESYMERVVQALARQSFRYATISRQVGH